MMDARKMSAVRNAPRRVIAEADRERVIQEFTHVVKAMAHRLAFRLPAYMDAEDLMSVGIMGLMDAMDKYDPTREAKFKTYAEFRIRGAMLDEIRSMDWIPRSVHERITLLQKTYSELLHRLGRPPTDQEVGKELKMSTEELDEFLTRSRGAVVISLDDLGVQDADGHKIISVLLFRGTHDEGDRAGAQGDRITSMPDSFESHPPLESAARTGRCVTCPSGRCSSRCCSFVSAAAMHRRAGYTAFSFASSSPIPS